MLVIPCDIERFCLQHAAEERVHKSQKYVRKTGGIGPQKTSPKSILEGGSLEATWEPPLKQGASKTSFLAILAPFWDPLWDQFELILGIIFLMFF